MFKKQLVSTFGGQHANLKSTKIDPPLQSIRLFNSAPLFISSCRLRLAADNCLLSLSGFYSASARFLWIINAAKRSGRGAHAHAIRGLRALN